MVKAYPEEFRRDVIAVAREGEAPVRQVAKDFGISETYLQRWLRIADRDDGVDGPRPAAGGSEAKELREARKRTRLLERENEILRRAATYLSQSSLPKSTRWSLTLPRTGSPSRCLPGAGLQQAGVLQVAEELCPAAGLGRRASDQCRDRRAPG